MIVTDKEIYLEKELVRDLDKALERQKKNWDNNFIIDGEEGAGKTTFSWGLGYYLAHKLGLSFTVDDIFFDVDKLMHAAAESKKRVLIWDEAALEALATNWQSASQKKLIQILMTSRKNGHFFIFLIPKFYKLTEYIAVDRSIMLFHVYSPDNMKRGYFTAYNRKKKEFFYEKYRASRKKPYHDFSYRGTFPKSYGELIDEVKYDDKKDYAIRSILSTEKKVDHNLNKLRKMQYLIYTSPHGTQKQKAEHFGVGESTIRTWSKLADKIDAHRGDSLGNQADGGPLLFPSRGNPE